MERSTEIDKLSQALTKLQAEGLVAVKTAENSQLKKRYADLIEVWEVIRPHLKPNGLALSQWPGQVRHLDGGNLAVGMTNMLSHESGQFICSTMEVPLPEPIIGKQSGQSAVNVAQRMGSALSYARRYGALCVLGIPSGDDDDARRAYQGVNREEEQQRLETWQDYYTTGAWRDCDSPDWGTLGEVKKASEMFNLLKGNAANGFSNLPLVAASAWTVEHLCKGRELSMAEGLAKANLGPDILTLTPEDLYAAVQVISSIPKPNKEELA